MKHSRTTFVFAPEFGARLRELRRRRDLSLRGLALLMDRQKPGSFNLLAKLERGELKDCRLSAYVQSIAAESDAGQG